VISSEHQRLLSFKVGLNAIREIAERINTWLAMPSYEREDLPAAMRKLTVEMWSWEGVARTVLAACAGRIDELPVPVLP
jgi:glycosyltransferase involved in cell wall biosynthesis